MKTVLLALFLAAPLSAQTIDTGPSNGTGAQFGYAGLDAAAEGQSFVALGSILNQFTFEVRNVPGFNLGFDLLDYHAIVAPFTPTGIVVGAPVYTSGVLRGFVSTTAQLITFSPGIALNPGETYIAILERASGV